MANRPSDCAADRIVLFSSPYGARYNVGLGAPAFWIAWLAALSSLMTCCDVYPLMCGWVLLWFCTSPTLSSCAINDGLPDTRCPQLNQVTGVRLFCLSRLTNVAVVDVGPSSNVMPT